MGVDVVGNSTGWWRVAQYWWVTLADYSRHIAPNITAACRHSHTSDRDGLNADQARKLGAELQRSVDDCSIDSYARQLFAGLFKKKSLPVLANLELDFGRRELPGHEQERRFVNEFVSEVQRFIDFLLACEGFRIQ
jgi:hypothetical protein